MISDDEARKLAEEGIEGNLLPSGVEDVCHKIIEVLDRQRWIAKQALLIQDALVKGDSDLAYHELYKMACPDMQSLTPWAEFEKLANSLPQPPEQ